MAHAEVGAVARVGKERLVLDVGWIVPAIQPSYSNAGALRREVDPLEELVGIGRAHGDRCVEGATAVR